MFEQFAGYLKINGQLTATSALRIGTERSAEPIGTDAPVLRDAYGHPFIPGSSLKGVLRSYLEAWVRGVVDAPVDMHAIACEPSGDAQRDWCIPVGRMADLRKRYKGADAQLTAAVERESCLLCLTFGSAWLASHVRVVDLPVVAELWAEQFEVRDGVAIDRDKETAADGKLYDYEVVPADTAFALHIVGENLTDWQKGLLWLGIRGLTKGKIALGGFTHRGLGWVQLSDYTAVVADESNFIKYLAGDQTGTPVTDTLAQTWVQALQVHIQQKVAQVKEAIYA